MDMEDPIWVCAVIIKPVDVGLSYWLKSDSGDARWSLPQIRLAVDLGSDFVIQELHAHWGMKVRKLNENPIAKFRRARHEEKGFVWAYPFLYLGVDTNIGLPPQFRYRWAFVEETIRIVRRKPLQRTIQQIDAKYSGLLPESTSD